MKHIPFSILLLLLCISNAYGNESGSDSDLSACESNISPAAQQSACEDYSCCNSPCSIKNVYFRAIIGKGFGRVNSYETIGFYIDRQYDCLIPFLDIRAHRVNPDHWGANIGGGLRYIDRCTNMAYGINAFYDYLDRHRGEHQFGIGGEVNAKCFDIFVNGYIPFGKRTHSHIVERIFFPEDLCATLWRHYHVLGGCDFEVGTNLRRWCPCSCYDISVGAGLYYYSGHRNRDDRHHNHFTGGRLRLAFNYLDMITVGVIGTHDDVFHSRLQGIIQLDFYFDQYGFHFGCQNNRDCCSQIRRKPVLRQEIIVESKPSCCWQTNY